MVGSKINTGESFVAGGFGGFCGAVLGHPLDTIKVRLQAMPLACNGNSHVYRGSFDCLQKTIIKEGIPGLFKGIGAPVLAVTPVYAVCFFSYDLGKSLVSNYPEKMSFREKCLAAMFAGVCTTTIMTPSERVKCLLQLQISSDSKYYNGPLDALRKLYRRGGLASVYRGTGATLLRDIPGTAIYFLTYEWLKTEFASSHNPHQFSFFNTTLAGGLAGVLNWTLILPVDVLKSRYQTAPDGVYPKGIRSVFHEYVQAEGLASLVRGAGPLVVRAFVASAACFLGYEAALQFLLSARMNS